MLNVGDRIYYTGDRANIEDEGTIIAVYKATKYHGKSCDIALDDGREFHIVSEISFDPAPGRRFWPLEEWEADRKKRLDAALASMRKAISC